MDGECRVRQLLDYGVQAGLGTVYSAGYSRFMLNSMHQASNMSKHLAIRNGDDKNVLGLMKLCI